MDLIHFVFISTAYVDHIATIFELAGYSQSDAQQNALNVLSVETVLAGFQLPPDEMGDPFTLYNKLDLSGLQEIAPQLPWQQFLNGIG
jgi:predicted metalloendopeptidase